MNTSKQERTVLHLEIDGQHHYFGSIKALCDNFGKERIGITYKSLANYGIAPDKPFSNKRCIIRKGTLIAATREEQE